jgi:DNA-directed RNA polymerase specialized sigma24 family protein
MSMGRAPCILGDGVFRGRASSTRIRNFEDAVVFVIDVERCLKRLDVPGRELVVRIALQEYTQGETAVLTGQSVRSVIRKYGDTLDRLTSLFFEAELFETRLPPGCQ